LISLHYHYDHRNSNTYLSGSAVLVDDASAPLSSSTKIIIGSLDGVEVTLDEPKKYISQPPVVAIPSASPIATSRQTSSIRIESEGAKRLRNDSLRKEQDEKKCEDEEGAERKRTAEEEERELIRKEEEEAAKKDRSPMVGSPSQGEPDNPIGSNRRRPEDGEKKKKKKKKKEKKGHGSREATMSFKGQSGVESSEIIEREVKALLDELTMERFDSISDQIIQWENKSVNEKDGRTLIQVIRLVFEKATDDAACNEMYALLCRKMMEQISPDVQDDGVENPEGKPIAGGQLFRKYLLNRCQEDFERGWFAKGAAAAKTSDGQATKTANEKNDTEEAELYSDEHYAAQKARRQGLGLIKFICELFKLQMLTERIMHECVKKLLVNVENPEEEAIESLCQLLKTVGQFLDTPKARAHMDVYFTCMKELGKSTNVSSRMQFMLQVCDES